MSGTRLSKRGKAHTSCGRKSKTPPGAPRQAIPKANARPGGIPEPVTARPRKTLSLFAPPKDKNDDRPD